jgi:hypothetical protein
VARDETSDLEKIPIIKQHGLTVEMNQAFRRFPQSLDANVGTDRVTRHSLSKHHLNIHNHLTN